MENKYGKGAVKDIEDSRDLKYDDLLGSIAPFTEEDWKKGYDVEKTLNFVLPIKNQYSSLSCVGQSFAYYKAILDLVETSVYTEQSAKAIYSQIFIPGGTSRFRDGASLLVNWGSLPESVVKSYKPDGTTTETFMEDKSWITAELNKEAKKLGASEYRMVSGITIDVFAQAIRDNFGIVAGVEGTNNGTWFSNEPQPPTSDTNTWGHALYFGKYGVDEKGKYIATPNNWGKRNPDSLHPDGWQKIRENWFAGGGRWIFSPWTLVDKNNNNTMDVQKFLIKNDLKFIRNQETGQFGRIIAKQLRVVKTSDRGTLLLLDQAVRENGLNVTNQEWTELPKIDF